MFLFINYEDLGKSTIPSTDYLSSMAKEIITPNSAFKPDDASAYGDKGLALDRLG